MAPLPVRAGLTAGALLLLGFLGWCSAQAGATPLSDPPPEITVLVLLFGMGAAPEVLWCESRGDWNARNGDHWGGWQLHRPSHEAKALVRGWSWEWAMEHPRRQTEIAIEVWLASGWKPWGECAPSEEVP